MKSSEETKSKNLGHIRSMKIKTDQPVKMDIDMEYNQLLLFCGTNGSGKSLVMKYNWAMATIASIMTNMAQMSPPLTKIAQDILDGTLEDQNINGELTAVFERGTLKLTLDHGKVVDGSYSPEDDVTRAAVPVFMSKVTRTFSQIQQYLKLEKEVGQEKMSKMYRIYDILYIEKLKHHLTTGFKLPENIKTALDGFDMAKHDIQELILENENVYFLNKIGEKKSLSTLSDGEQSLINMSIAPSL